VAIALGAIVGVVLALTGAGGGVLAIPLLVFGLHLQVQQAAPVGLFAVGLAASVGAGLGLRERIVRYRAAAMIGVAGMLAAPMGVTLAQLLPNRPLLSAFALMLAYTAWRMLMQPAQQPQRPRDAPCLVGKTDQRLIWTLPCARALASTGFVSGLLSGMLGVGGGFVIVPALTRYTDLDIRSIQVTSLAVIALVSVSGVCAAAWHGTVPWDVALPFGTGAMLALLIGRRVAGQLNTRHLQQAFAWICVVVALLMLASTMGWLAR